MPEFLFLVRSYNEAERIGSTIDSIFSAGYSRVLVVDDGSTDATESLLSGRNDIFYLRHPFNRGGGAALETGFEFVRRNAQSFGITHVVTFDADGQMDIADMENFLSCMRERPQVDVWLGSRSLGSASHMPILRRIVLWGGRLFTWGFSGVRLSDAHNGYRVLSVKAIRSIRLTMDGMEYASELIDELVRNQLSYAETPVNIRYDEYSLSKGQKNLNALRIVSRMIYKRFFDS
ncbi:MAG TPA: glycosyltransferase family 2 protein [bacterium]|nr:glycosyltransferase family 2 protein [bacterium]